MAAHEVCSAMFVSGLDGKRAFAADVAPQLGPAAALVRVKADAAGKTVTATLAGMYARRAAFSGAYGCVVGPGAPGTSGASAAAGRAQGPQHVPLAAEEAAADAQLATALNLAFEEPSSGARRRTYAAVIVHDGRIVAERYAAGIRPDTPLHGWSMSKSITNALLAILVKQGRLDMLAPAPVAEWRDPADPRHQITPDDLLRMRSGLDVGQSLMPRWDAPFDPANRITFSAPDMGSAAARRPLKWPVRSRWNYSDGNTVILGRLIRDIAGHGDPAATQAFARRELFDKLGMGPVTVETDATGSPIGSTQVYATARDWARLGQLYLDDGMVGDQRILPPGWVGYSTRFTPGSEAFGYGSGFWVKHGLGDEGLPNGSFMARGARGQYVIVVPAARLVIVKLGDADRARDDFKLMVNLVRSVVDWTHMPRSATQAGRPSLLPAST